MSSNVTIGAALKLRQVWAVAQRILRSSESALILLSAALGAMIGALIASLHRLVDLLHRVSFNLPPGATLSAGIGVDWIRILIVPVCGGLLVGFAALVSQRFRFSETVDPIEANALHGGRMSLRDSLRLVGATVVSNASGASVGMEAGYSQLGAVAFSVMGRFALLRRADQRVFLAAGAGAAIAAAFNAPLAGAFYAFELILGTYSARALAPVAAASLAAVLAERDLIHLEPLFAVSQSFHFKQSVFLIFALLGVLSAGFGVLVMQSVTWAERGLKRLPLPQWLRPALGGALLTAIALYAPQALGSGHGAIQFHFDHNVALGALVAVLIGKLLASAISVGSGFRGGMFSSSLFLGCLFGAVFADAAEMLVPRLGVHHVALMMVGMGSVAAAVIGAPLTMVFLVLEGTGDFPITIGVMVGVVIASTIVRLTFGYSFSTWRFHQRGIGIFSAHDVGWLIDLTVAKLMRTDPKIVPMGMPVAELREKFPLGGTKRIFVVDPDGRYAGAVDVALLHDAKHDANSGSLSAGELAVHRDDFLLPGQNVRVALQRFEDSRIESLPVLSSPVTRSLVGYMTEAYALRRYNQELERRRSTELGARDLFSIFDPKA